MSRPAAETTGLGAVVRSLRKIEGMSLLDLSKKCGLSKGSLSRIENGTDNVTLVTLRTLALALSVTPVWMVTNLFLE